MRGSRFQPSIQLISGLVLLSWPFLVWFGFTHNALHWLLPAIALMLILRFYQIRQKAGPMRFVVKCVALVGIILCAASYLLQSHQWLLFYPVVVNFTMLAVFGGSLWTAMPLVERLARLTEPALSPDAIRYTRRVTQVWCVFFIFNGSIALFTALQGDIQLWTIWNGMIAYLLMGALMASEWLIRRRLIKREMQ